LLQRAAACCYTTPCTAPVHALACCAAAAPDDGGDGLRARVAAVAHDEGDEERQLHLRGEAARAGQRPAGEGGGSSLAPAPSTRGKGASSDAWNACGPWSTQPACPAPGARRLCLLWGPPSGGTHMVLQHILKLLYDDGCQQQSNAEDDKPAGAVARDAQDALTAAVQGEVCGASPVAHRAPCQNSARLPRPGDAAIGADAPVNTAAGCPAMLGMLTRSLRPPP